MRLLLLVAALVAALGLPGRALAQTPGCPPGQAPRFVFGFAELQALLGEAMGEPATCEFPDPNGTGDVHQVTSTGLAFWRKSTNTPTFTTGWEHWALTPEGLVSWTGESIDPPGSAEAAPAQPAPGPASDPLGRGRIPVWLQARSARTPLYADPDGEQVTGTLAQWSYLRVLGAADYRLQVQLAEGAGGWVEPGNVQPSEPGEGWLLTEQPVPLFAGPEAGAWVVGDLGPSTYLRQVGGAAAERVPVRVYTPDFQALAATGWVEATAVQATAPPAASVLIIRDTPARPNPFAGDPRGLMEAVAAVARELKPSTGIPVSVTVAQAILESNWGDSVLSREAHNYLGVKAYGRLGNDGVVWFTTEEYDAAGNLYEALEPFRAYKSLADSVADHHRLLHSSPDYVAARQVPHDPREFARRLQAGGYSTDPAYADKLIVLMDRYDLYRFDA